MVINIHHWTRDRTVPKRERERKVPQQKSKSSFTFYDTSQISGLCPIKNWISQIYFYINHSRPLFVFLQFLTHNNVMNFTKCKMFKVMHLVFGTRIRTHNLFNMPKAFSFFHFLGKSEKGEVFGPFLPLFLYFRLFNTVM